MQTLLLVLTLFITAFGSLSFTKASPVAGNHPSQVALGPSDVLLGWTGIRRKVDADAFQKQPYASKGGELGAVLYIADSTDLARFFAKGEEGSGYVCEVYANGKAWSIIAKYWVSQKEIVEYKGKMQDLHPGAVLFASHTAAGLGPGDDSEPWQMGIRPGSITPLGVTAKCYPASNAAVAPHKKINYATRLDWNIQGTPERGP
ncbi:hypothetical protein BYT27DRAFT_7213446 [Phlegmacium glaucopus]|nr:hypothetical protein BYT27DRAFT_7213446 [Phlegmacium glaucopus]